MFINYFFLFWININIGNALFKYVLSHLCHTIKMFWHSRISRTADFIYSNFIGTRPYALNLKYHGQKTNNKIHINPPGTTLSMRFANTSHKVLFHHTQHEISFLNSAALCWQMNAKRWQGDVKHAAATLCVVVAFLFPHTYILYTSTHAHTTFILVFCFMFMCCTIW